MYKVGNPKILAAIERLRKKEKRHKGVRKLLTTRKILIEDIKLKIA